MTIGLTERQSEVLAYVRHHKNWYGDSPSLKEMSAAFGWSSLNSSEQHINALCAKKFLVRSHNDLRIINPKFCEHCGGRS